MSVQCPAVASQNFTCPTVTAVPPDTTVAVRVTTVPDATLVTLVPPDVTAKIVMVAVSDSFAAAPAVRANHDSSENSATLHTYRIRVFMSFSSRSNHNLKLRYSPTRVVPH